MTSGRGLNYIKYYGCQFISDMCLLIIFYKVIYISTCIDSFKRKVYIMLNEVEGKDFGFFLLFVP